VRYARRIDDYRLPKGKAEREALASLIGSDGLCLLKAVYAPDAPPRARTLGAVETLRQVWLQQVRFVLPK
jgi:transposase